MKKEAGKRAKMSKNKDSGETNSRRYFLSTVAASSVVSTIGIGTALTERNRTVVVTRDERGPVRKKSVPQRWLRSENRAQQAASRLHNNIGRNSAIHRIMISGRDKRVGNHRLPKILVEKQEGTSVSIPELQTDIPVETTTVDYDITRMSHCYTDEEDPLPGGVHFGNSEGHDGGGTGTGVVMDGNGDVCYMTAYHVINPSSCGGLGDGYHYQNYVGNAHTAVPTHDAVLIKPSTNNDLNNNLDEPHIFTSDTSPSKHNVRSWYTATGMNDVRAQDETVYKQGIMTGELPGEITSANNSLQHICVDVNSSFVGTFDTVPGDSGGPIYTKNNGDLEILGFTYSDVSGQSGKACSSDKYAGTTGLAFYPLHNDFGWSFYTDNMT